MRESHKAPAGSFREVEIAGDSEDPKSFSDVMLGIDAALGIKKDDVLAAFGTGFRGVPRNPDDFVKHTIVYDPDRGTEFFFTFGQNDILNRVIVRKF